MPASKLSDASLVKVRRNNVTTRVAAAKPHVIIWCIQEQQAQRPSMEKVVQMLDGVMELERPPPPKSLVRFFSTTTTASEAATPTWSRLSTVVPCWQLPRS